MPKPTRSSTTLVIRLFWGYWRRFPKLLIGSAFYGPAYAMEYVVAPLFVTIGLSELVRQHHVSVSLMVLAGITLGIAVITGYFTNAYFEATLEHHVEDAMYNDSFKYLVNQDYDFFANNFSGSLVTKSNRLIKAYTAFHGAVFLDLQGQIWIVLIALGVMTYLNPLFGLATIILWAISATVIVYLAIGRIPLRHTATAKESIQTGELADMTTNALAVKTFAGEAVEIERYRTTNIVRGDLFYRNWRRAISNGFAIELLCAVMQMAIFIGGVLAVEHNVMSLAVFLLYQVYALRIVDSLRKSSLLVRQFEGAFGDAQEMAELLLQPPLVEDAARPEPSRISKGAIEMQKVHFGYHDDASANTALFTHLDLSIPKGQKVGLVGPSGGGKTTITKLLLRFMDVQSGAIIIDGQDIRTIKQTDLRRAISYVPQEPALFHRSIRENIAYGKPEATDKEIIAVAKKAFAHEFIQSLPSGYNTLVGERGVKLSGGQRQRIAIARAMLKDAPILVLDEATSALDSESEKVIQEALWQLMDGRTALVIAHRLSTIQRLDRIVVLEEGTIIEDGKHATLLKDKGLYAKLWAHQSGGFMEED